LINARFSDITLSNDARGATAAALLRRDLLRLDLLVGRFF
jgi:hypothetical protein